VDLKLPDHIDPGHVVGEDSKRYQFHGPWENAPGNPLVRNCRAPCQNQQQAGRERMVLALSDDFRRTSSVSSGDSTIRVRTRCGACGLRTTRCFCGRRAVGPATAADQNQKRSAHL